MLSFFLLNLGIAALFFAAIPLLANRLKIKPVTYWYENLFGDLSSGIKNNRWAVVVTVVVILLNVEWFFAGNGKPLKSSLPSAVANLVERTENKAVDEKWSDGQIMKRISYLMGMGDLPAQQSKEEYSAKKVAEKEKSRAKKAEESGKYSSWIWMWAAVISWPLWLISLTVIFFDDVIGWFVVLAGMLKRKSATVSGTAISGGGETPAGSSGTTGEPKKRKFLPKWLSWKWWLEYLSDDLIADFGADLIRKRLERKGR
ncbi:MAG: hypothetical protein AAB358_04005 [Patescibacteria group bacterium]